MNTIQSKSFSMKNLQDPKSSSFTICNPFDFAISFEQQYEQLNENNKMNECDKMRAARQSLHRYIFTIGHTIQHFGHHLTAAECQLLRCACEQTLHWMWHGKIKSAEDYRRRIMQLLKICTPLMQRLFQAEQRGTDRFDNKYIANIFDNNNFDNNNN